MTDRPLNILIVASWYPDESHPTNGSFVEEQARMLAKYGHQVTVLHPYLLGSFSTALFQKNVNEVQRRNGIQVLHVGVKPMLLGFRKLAYDKLYRTCLKTLEKNNIKLHDFDVIHSHALFMGGYIAMNLAKKTEKGFFHTEHTSGLIFNSAQYTKSDIGIIKQVYHVAQKVFFVSCFALEKTLAQYKIESDNRFLVIPNVVDDSFFQHPLLRINEKPFKYINISNIVPRKRVDMLLRAWEQVLGSYSDSKLTIAGEGPELPKLIKIVADLKLEDSVSFLPKLGRVEVKEQISEHHVLVSTSEVETFGLTVAEAQAMGKPVVVTDSGGVRDIVDENTGIVCGNTSQSIAHGLIRIQELYTDYNPNHIRLGVKTKFSLDVVYSELLKHYTQS